MQMDTQVTLNSILEQLRRETQLSDYVDWSLHIPKPYCGTGEIKLIVLGQDPTVKKAKSRKTIKTVLNLDKNSSVWVYLSRLCNDLDLKLNEHVYATNLYKNFFIASPTQITEIDIFQEFRSVWLPMLVEEILQFPHIPIITLGEPILAPLVKPSVSAKVSQYWGYTPDWKQGGLSELGCIEPDNNYLGRPIFPFPHQPSLRNAFYKTKLKSYTAFVKATMFSRSH